MEAIWENLQESFTDIGTMVAGMAKNLIIFLVILIIGLIVARIIRKVIKKILKFVKFDEMLDKVGIDDFFANAGIQANLSGILAGLVYWTILITFLVVGLDAVGVKAVSAGIFDKLLAFVPNLIAAILVAVVGFALSKFVGKTVSSLLGNAGIQQSELMGNIAKTSILILASIIALDQLGIEGSYFRILLGALGVGLALALGISFGIGGQDWARDIVNKNLRK